MAVSHLQARAEWGEWAAKGATESIPKPGLKSGRKIESRKETMQSHIDKIQHMRHDTMSYKSTVYQLPTS